MSEVGNGRGDSGSPPAVGTLNKPPDLWTERARPTFLYVIYVMLLWALPMGVVAAANPAMATRMIDGMTRYLAGIPEPLYALFGTGYVGYTFARQWGKWRARA